MAFPDTDLDIIVEAYIGADLQDTIADWPAATDLSSRLLRKPIQIRRGRGTNQKTAQAGACTLWLDNTDGALTPLLPTSVYYPRWDLGCPIRVSVDNVGAFPPYVRHAGFVADITAVMVPGVGGENISAVQVTTAGVLRRLTQGAVERSPLTQSLLSGDPVAMWALEDPDGATQGESAVVGGYPLVATTVDADNPVLFGSTGADGGLASAYVPPTGRLAGAVSGCSDQQWTFEFAGRPEVDNSIASFQLLCPGSSAANIVSVYMPDFLGGTPQFRVFFGTTLGDAVSLASPVITDAAFFDDFHAYAVVAERSGASIAAELYIDGDLVDSDSGTGDLGAVTEVRIEPLQGFGIGSISHLTITNAAEVRAGGAVNAYAGEQAHDRIQRLCGEEGIPYSGTATQSVECGPQPVATVVAVLQDAEQVDHGMIVEDMSWGLDYRASSQRENLDVTLTVDLSTYRTTAGTQRDVLAPVRNDARLRNEWTITRPGGSSATARDQTNIAKRGRYDDSATVNVVDDARTLDEAQWRVREGTFDGLRYETVPLDIAANLGDS